MPEVSIIIPTYKDWNRLSVCLEALENQSFPKNEFEIFVVNNDIKDDGPSGFRIPGNAVLLKEGKPGSYCARNTALKLAKGKIIGFTDSDCIPDKDWIKNAVDFFSANKEYSRIAGNIELFYKSDKLTLAELYEKVYSFKQDFAASKGIGVTGNMFTYRYVFDKVGDFNEDLLSGGDNEWSLRAQQAGFKIAFVKNVNIKHPARHKLEELEKKAKRVAGNVAGKPEAIKRLVKYSIPPVISFKKAAALTLDENLKVFGVRYYLNVIRSIEEVKIAFGKNASRQ